MTVRDRIYKFLKDYPLSSASEVSEDLRIPNAKFIISQMFRDSELIRLDSDLGPTAPKLYSVIPRRYRATVWLLDATTEVIEGYAGIHRHILTLDADNEDHFKALVMDKLTRHVDDQFWFGPVSKVL
jgi:hypothetical protein